MEIQLFEDDEFPIWVNINTNKVICVGFCMQCPLDPLKADCKNTLPILAKVKAILVKYDILPICNIYRYYIGMEDYLNGIIKSLKESLQNLKEDKETELFSSKIKNAIEDISMLYRELTLRDLDKED